MTTWVKPLEELTIVFNIQKSQWGSDVWYYSFGISLRHFYEGSVKSSTWNHVQERFDQKIESRIITPDMLLAILEKWETRYGSIPVLRERVRYGEIPYMTMVCEHSKDTLMWLSELEGISDYNDWDDAERFKDINWLELIGMQNDG